MTIIILKKYKKVYCRYCNIFSVVACKQTINLIQKIGNNLNILYIISMSTIQNFNDPICKAELFSHITKPLKKSQAIVQSNKKPDMRERLLERGPESLTDSDLVAILLRTGIKDKSVKVLADDIITHIDKSRPEKIESYLRSIRGMGDSKISTIMAAIELGRRYYNMHGRIIAHPSDAVPLLQHYAARNQEHFICVSLNGANEIIATRVVSIGILTKALVHPREVFSDAIKERAAAIILAHNHPSGNVCPSKEDILITNRLYEAGTILGIKVLDHIILAPSGEYFSFIQNDISLKGG